MATAVLHPFVPAHVPIAFARTALFGHLPAHRLPAARTTRSQLHRRAFTDEPAPLLVVAGRKQLFEWRRDEVRVAVPGLAIGESQLRALGHEMDVLG